MLSKFQLLRYLPATIALVTFVVSAIASGALIWHLEMTRFQNVKTQVASHIAIHAQAIQSHIEHALSVTYTLATLVKQGDGHISDFNNLGTDILGRYPEISTLSLSPKGILRKIVPLDGNENAFGFNQLNDPFQSKEAIFARDSGTLSLSGPLNLSEGGTGFMGLMPVYLTSRHGVGKPVFWGFVNVAIRLPGILAFARLDELMKEGFDYELWRNNPETHQKQIVASTSKSLIEPVSASINVTNSQWTLSVAPVKGWGDEFSLMLQGFLGLSLSLLLAYFSKLLVKTQIRVEKSESSMLESEQQLRIAATAFESHEGIMVTDANQFIVKVNKAFTQITGYSAEEALGKTPKILNSGRHDAAFFKVMWESLNTKHYWQGEIWNRNKNGDIYPECHI